MHWLGFERSTGKIISWFMKWNGPKQVSIKLCPIKVGTFSIGNLDENVTTIYGTGSTFNSY